MACGTIAGGACGASNARPYLTPFSSDPVDTLVAEPDVVVRHLGTVFERDSIPVRALAPAEGYLESGWFDATRFAPDSAAATAAPVVKLRFWVDPLGEGRVRVVGEAVVRRVVDPSLPPRQREVAVEPEHPGASIVTRLMQALRERFPRPASSSERRR